MRVSVPVGRTPTGRRTFPLAYKIEFLRLWDEAAQVHGGKTRLLRENALSIETVRRWIRSRDRGEFEESMVTAASTPSKGMLVEAQDRAKMAKLIAENKRLKRKAAEADAALEIMGKAFELLEGITTSSEDELDQIPQALMSAEQYRMWLERKGLS